MAVSPRGILPDIKDTNINDFPDSWFRRKRNILRPHNLTRVKFAGVNYAIPSI